MQKILIDLHYFPSVNYMADILRFQHVELETCENYQKQTYRNRCNVLTANGVQSLTVPVKNGSDKNIRSIQIDNEQRWKQIHWRTIQSAYGKASYFEFYAPYFEQLIMADHSYLFDLNYDILSMCLKLLKIKTNIFLSSTYQSEIPADMLERRNFYLPNTHKPEYIEKSNKSYYQLFGKVFVANLSILDLLFNEGTNSLKILYEY